MVHLMFMSVNTNIAAMKTAHHYHAIQANLAQATERLASGKRINSAADDAAGAAIITRMNSQIRGIEVATRNAHDGINMAQTAEGVLTDVQSMLQRMRELAIQAASSMNSD